MKKAKSMFEITRKRIEKSKIMHVVYKVDREK